jgi:hypothetical protein
MAFIFSTPGIPDHQKPTRFKLDFHASEKRGLFNIVNLYKSIRKPYSSAGGLPGLRPMAIVQGFIVTSRTY